MKRVKWPGEFLQFLMEQKKYWLIPMALFLFAVGILMYLSSGTVVAPFVYAIF